MADENLQSLQELMGEFNDLSLTDFRDAFHQIVKDKNPTVDRFLVSELKNWRGNRTIRAEFAAALALREDENYIEDFSIVIEKETEVGLCKECINGLSRIGSQLAIQKLEYLTKSKPNATISSLLRQELEKIKHEEKEPTSYYLEHLSDGNKNARNCIHAAKVLIKMGDNKVVQDIIDKMDQVDDLARSEGARVVSQLANGSHLPAVLDVLDQYSKTFQENAAFIDILDELDATSKEDRLARIVSEIRNRLTEEQVPFFEQLKTALESHLVEQAEQIKDSIIELQKVVGLEYLLKSMILISDNKIAHATSYHEETQRATKVRQSRLRHMVGHLGYGIGKITGQFEVDPEQRKRAIEWATRLVTSQDGDVTKLALYGTAFMVRPEDEKLLQATLKSHQIEGMTRLITALERKHEQDFTDFFLNVAMNHEILDIQEMAMRALGCNEIVFDKLREMLEDANPETRRTAIRIIGEIKAQPFIKSLTGLLEGQSDIIRIEAIRALGKIGNPIVLEQINEVMLDAKSPVLVETGLEATAQIGGHRAIELLHRFADTTRNRKTAVTAIKLLAASYKSWTNPLPAETSELILKHLQPWLEERDKVIRHEAYSIAGSIITLDLKLYDKLKVLFKDVSTRLRGQTNWDKSEMELVEKWVRTLNRNYFFLKDLLEFQKTVSNNCRGADNESSSARMHVFERLIKCLAKNERFILSAENEGEIENLVLKGLEQAESSWTQLDVLYQIAGYAISTRLKDELSTRVADVPKQAKNSLMEALARQGFTLAEIAELSSIKDILILEGSGFFRKRLVKFLEDIGYQVRHTDDLDIALTMIHNKKPDLLLSEITFKEVSDGIDFIEKIAAEYNKKIQLIISTNTREVSVMERVAKVQPKKILFKPYPLESLEEAIKG